MSSFEHRDSQPIFDAIRGLPAHDLTFIAEDLGAMLALLLEHESPLVREGAIYGVGHAWASLPELDESKGVTMALAAVRAAKGER